MLGKGQNDDLKTYLEKEKVLETRIFSFSQNIFLSVKGKFKYLRHLISHLQMLLIVWKHWEKKKMLISKAFFRVVKSPDCMVKS